MAQGDTTAAVAIVGIGTAQQTEPVSESGDDLAALAALQALEDAGIGAAAVDGLVSCKSVEGTGSDVAVGRLLGISPRYSQTLDYGSCNFSLHLAAMAVAVGMATTIVLTYGTTARSTRMNFGVPTGNGGLEAQSGLVHIAGPAALAMRRHMHLYGTTEQQLGMIPVAQRQWAADNPAAAFRDPLSLDDYLAMPYLVEPLRRADVTMRSDGGAALVVTTPDRASHLRCAPVDLIGMAEQSALRRHLDLDNIMRPWLADVGEQIWATTGLRPPDVDLLYVQDPTSVWVLQMLEHFGFCPVGDGGPYLAEGHTLPGGDLPLNTNGGQLSEAYMWGWLHLCEAVRQLRGGADGRQVSGAEIALYCSTQGFAKGAASVLAARR